MPLHVLLTVSHAKASKHDKNIKNANFSLPLLPPCRRPSSVDDSVLHVSAIQLLDNYLSGSLVCALSRHRRRSCAEP